MESLALVPEMLPSILLLSGSGMVNQQTKYATKVIPPVRKANTAHATLTMVGSTRNIRLHRLQLLKSFCLLILSISFPSLYYLIFAKIHHFCKSDNKKAAFVAQPSILKVIYFQAHFASRFFTIANIRMMYATIPGGEKMLPL